MDKVVLIQAEELRGMFRQILQEELSKINTNGQPTSQVKNLDEPLLSRKSIAQFLEISLVTLTDWTNNGLPYLRKKGKMYFLKSEVLDYMRNRKKGK